MCVLWLTFFIIFLLYNLLDHEFRLNLRTNYFLKKVEKDGFLHGKIQITIFNVKT